MYKEKMVAIILYATLGAITGYTGDCVIFTIAVAVTIIGTCPLLNMDSAFDTEIALIGIMVMWFIHELIKTPHHL